MTTNSRAPRALTTAEWNELAKNHNVITAWKLHGVAPRVRGHVLASSAHGAAFPRSIQHVRGYEGDLYVLIGDGVAGIPMLITMLRRRSRVRFINRKRELPK